MNSFKSDFQETTYGEYQATKSTGIKSQIISSTSTPIESLAISNSQNFNFSQILPVKVLPTISEEEFSNMNPNLNSISTTQEINTNLDLGNLQPTPTLDTVQNYEGNIIEGNQDLNIINLESGISSENNIDVNNLVNTDNFGDNNIISDTNENLDINTLTTTNIETTQTFDANTFQTTESTPSFDINNIPEETNIDTNTYQTSEPINIDTTTTITDNIDLNTLTTTNIETTQTFDANTFQTTESTPSFDINNIPETTNIDTNTYQTSEPINIDATTTTTDNIDLNTLTTTNIETTQTFDANTLQTTETTPSFDINNIPETTNIDTNTYQIPEATPIENYEVNNIDINNFQTSEPLIDTPKESTIESTPSFDINNLNINTTEQTYNTDQFQVNTTPIETTSDYNITNLEPKNIDIPTEIPSEITPVIDTTSALQTTTSPEFDINAFLSTTEETKQIGEENIRATPTFNINTNEIKYDEYQTKEISQVISTPRRQEVRSPNPLTPNIIRKKEMEFCIVTPLQGKIAKGKEIKNIAKVTPVPSYGINTYRPFEGKSELKFGKISNNMNVPNEYKSSTFNPKIAEIKK